MRFPAKKTWHSLPPSGCLGTSLPLPQSLCGRTDVRTDGHVTITSEPKFLGVIVYQISLAMELRWRALPAGSAINAIPKHLILKSRTRQSSALRNANDLTAKAVTA